MLFKQIYQFLPLNLPFISASRTLTTHFILHLYTCFFLAIAAVHFLFIAYFWLRFAVYKPSNTTTEDQPDRPFSVVIAAKNEEQNLEKNIKLWLSQQYHSPFEVIVVNDRSSDKSLDILNEYAEAFSHFKFVNIWQDNNQTNGKMLAITLGIKAATHPNILLTDADCEPASDFWLQNIAQGYQKPGVEMVIGYGKIAEKKSLLSYFIQYDTAITAINYFGFHLAKMTYMGVGRNLSYTKTLFFRHKGFSRLHQTSFGDDDLFVARNATKTNVNLCIAPQAHTISEPQANWNDWFVQKKRHLITGKSYMRSHLFWLSVGYFSFIALLCGLCAAVFYFTQQQNWVQLQICGGAGLVVLCARWLVVSLAATKLTEGRVLVLLPILDVVYPFFQLIWSFQAYFFKVKKWR